MALNDIFLYAGEPNPNDIKLRDPTVPAGGGGAQTITASGLAIPIAFGAHTLTQTINATGLAIPLAFGSHALTQTISATGLAVPIAFGSHTISLVEPQTITATGLAIPIAFGSHTLSSPAVVQPPITGSWFALPAPPRKPAPHTQTIFARGLRVVIKPRARTILARGLNLGLAFGQARLVPQPATIRANGLQVGCSPGRHRLRNATTTGELMALLEL